MTGPQTRRPVDTRHDGVFETDIQALQGRESGTVDIHNMNNIQHIQPQTLANPFRKSTVANELDVPQAALVTYVTAGYPKPELMPGILLAMQKGGAGT